MHYALAQFAPQLDYEKAAPKPATSQDLGTRGEIPPTSENCIQRHKRSEGCDARSRTGAY